MGNKGDTMTHHSYAIRVVFSRYINTSFCAKHITAARPFYNYWSCSKVVRSLMACFAFGAIEVSLVSNC